MGKVRLPIDSKYFSRQSIAWRYILAVLLVSGALAMRLSLEPLLNDGTPFLIFFGAITIASWYGGFGPGICATLLCAVYSKLFFVEPRYSLVLAEFADVARYVFFILEGGLISWIAYQMHSAQHMARRHVRKLEHTKAPYSSVTENVSDYMICILDTKGTSVSWNPGVEAITGYSESEFIGQKTGVLFTPDDKKKKAHMKEMQAAKRHGKAIDERWHVRKDGSYFFANGSLSALRDKEGKLQGYIKSARDSTAQKEEEDILKIQSQVLQNMGEGVSLSNSDGIILYTNPAEDKMFGYDPGELIGRHVSIQNNYPPKQNQRIVKRVIKQLKSKGSWQGEWQNIKKDGTPFITRSLITSVKINDTDHWVCVQEDVTERNRLEKQRDEFIGVASHGLKTPVTSMKAFIQAMSRHMEKKGDDQAVTTLAKVDAQINKLTTLISDLLDVTRVQSGNLTLHKQFFDLDHLIENVVKDMQLTTDRHTISIEGKANSRVFADQERTTQVLINFISNAIKYSPNSDKIIVRAEKNLVDVTVYVVDFGIGIPRHKQRQIFDRFVRVGGKTQQTFPGLGLGLYICSQIIKLHDGKIGVRSHKDAGSTFYFSLPVKIKPAKRTLKQRTA